MKHISSDLLNYILDEVFGENILGMVNINTHYKIFVNTDFSIIIKSGKMAVYNNKSKDPILINHDYTKKANIVNFKFMVRYVECVLGV